MAARIAALVEAALQLGADEAGLRAHKKIGLVDPDDARHLAHIHRANAALLVARAIERVRDGGAAADWNDGDHVLLSRLHNLHKRLASLYTKCQAYSKAHLNDLVLRFRPNDNVGNSVEIVVAKRVPKNQARECAQHSSSLTCREPCDRAID